MNRRLAEALPGGRTFDEVARLVANALSVMAGDDYVWMRDLTDEWVAYERAGGCYRRDYTVAEDGTVTLADEVTKVEVRTTYTEVLNGAPVADVDDDEAEYDNPILESAAAADHVDGRVLEARGHDGDGGRVFRVAVLQYGTSRNGRRYIESVMRAAVPLYEGARVFDHHRTDTEMQTSAVAGLVGQLRGVEATTTGLEADLHLLPSATHVAEAFAASVDAQAAQLPPLCGISHDVMARYRWVVEEGRRVQEATQITAVHSVDVVADPAAGGRPIRMVAGGLGADPHNPEDQMNLTQIREALSTASPEERAELAAFLGGGAPTSAPNIHARESVTGRLIVRTAVADAGLPDRVVPVITGRLPEQFTEADLAAAVEGVQAMAEAFELADLAPTVPNVQVGTEDFDRKAQALDAMLDPRGRGGYSGLKEAYADIVGVRGNPWGRSSEDLCRNILREAYEGLAAGSTRLAESVASSTFSNMLGDSVTRRMLAVYNLGYLQDWRRMVSSIVPLGDFRTQRRERMGGYGNLPVVNQGAPYQPLTTPSDEEVTYVPAKRGGTEDLTMEAIANDDLGALRRIPQLLGEAAGATIYELIFDFLATNPTIYDSTALFHSTHGSNTASGALAQSTLTAARTVMRRQSRFGLGTRRLNLVPRFLVVPPDLEEMAFQLTTSAVAIPASGNASNIPNIHTNLEVIVSPYLSDTNDWFVIGDPSFVDTVEVGFLNGREEPELFTQADQVSPSMFASDKVTYKIRHVYGAAVVDFRPFYRGVG